MWLRAMACAYPFSKWPVLARLCRVSNCYVDFVLKPATLSARSKLAVWTKKLLGLAYKSSPLFCLLTIISKIWSLCSPWLLLTVTERGSRVKVIVFCGKIQNKYNFETFLSWDSLTRLLNVLWLSTVAYTKVDWTIYTIKFWNVSVLGQSKLSSNAMLWHSRLQWSVAGPVEKWNFENFLSRDSLTCLRMLCYGLPPMQMVGLPKKLKNKNSRLFCLGTV